MFAIPWKRLIYFGMIALALCKRRVAVASASTISSAPFGIIHHRHHQEETVRILPKHHHLSVRAGGGKTRRLPFRNFGNDSKTKQRPVTNNTTTANDDVSIPPKGDEKKKTIITERRFVQSLRQGAGGILSGLGFVISSIQSLASSNNDIKTSYRKPLKSLERFLKVSGVQLEMEQSLNRHMAVNLALLARIQIELWNDRWKNKKKRKINSPSGSRFWKDAKRYMRYATAVYGQAMIHAAEVDARGRIEFEHFGKITKDSISSHINVPSDDIRLLDVNYDGDSHHLRHFVAIDHVNQKVVLAIRGTFNLQEVIVDVTAFTREFCGGEAHSEMATMAERVWEKTGPTVSSLLNDHPGYEFVVVGHSLGAGTACLLTTMVLSQKLVKSPIQCFAYASPPVFSPLDVAPGLDVTTNFIHQQDVVPFLSVNSVRHLFSRLQTIQSFAQDKLSRRERLQVAVGWKPIPQDLIDTFLEEESNKVLSPIKGAPRLEIPAGQTIWLHEKNDQEYTWECLKPKDLIRYYSGIRIHPEMFTDHFPPRYEHALEHLNLPGK